MWKLQETDFSLCSLHNVMLIYPNKVLLRTRHEDPEGEYLYSSSLPSISALDGVGG